MKINFDVAREQSKEFYKEITNDNIDDTCNFNFHSQTELYFVDKGKINATINGHQMLLTEGQMAIVLGYDAHLFRSVEESKSCLLLIAPDICHEFTLAVQNKQNKNPFITDEATVKLIKSYIDEIRKPDCNEVKFRGFLYVILGIVLENIFLEKAENSENTELSGKILSYLNQNFTEEITLKSLSSTFGYTESYLSRYFKSCVGVGIIRYVNILRLKNFLVLMRERKYSHTYCAIESGFTSMKTFYRVFKEEFKCSPREYLKKSPKTL